MRTLLLRIPLMSLKALAALLHCFQHADTSGLTAVVHGVRRRTSRIRPILSAAFLVALTLGVPIASFAGPCGGVGQRACCNGGFEGAAGWPAPLLMPCSPNLSQAPGCNDPNGCACGPIPSESSLGMCYPPTVCGGPGQRACCNGDFEFANNPTGVLLACQEGLVQLPGGCSPGNQAGCVCGGGSVNSPFPGEYSSGICVQPAGCGGAGQRACCFGFLEYPRRTEPSEPVRED